MPMAAARMAYYWINRGALGFRWSFFCPGVQLDEYGTNRQQNRCEIVCRRPKTPIIQRRMVSGWMRMEKPSGLPAATSTVGKINPDGSVAHFQLDNLAAMAHLSICRDDGTMWGTNYWAVPF